MKKYKFFLLVILIINFTVTFGQQNLKSSPLYKFLKSNGDSTIILHYQSTWEIPPKYMILSKKGDTISTFTYDIINNTDKRAIMPHNFMYKLFEVGFLKFNKGPASINEFFHPKYISADSLRHLWRSVMSVKPWGIKDDKIDGVGCPISHDSLQRMIRDGSSLILDLITKKEILPLKFYAPDYYEKEICPGRDSRQRVLKIDKLFRSYFGDY